MSYQKTTYGYVVQNFNDQGNCVTQEFICGDGVEYENEDNEQMDAPEEEQYQPFLMMQPEVHED